MAVKLILMIGFMVVNGVTTVHAQARQEAPGADLIVHNARIFHRQSRRRNPRHPALAVKSGRICSRRHGCHRGDRFEERQHPGHRFPRPAAHSGIIDAHTHVLNEGGYNYTLRWEGVPSPSNRRAWRLRPGAGCRASRSPPHRRVRLSGCGAGSHVVVAGSLISAPRIRAS